MTTTKPLSIVTLIAGASLFAAAGATGMFLLLRPAGQRAPEGRPAAAPPRPADTGEIAVTLTEDVIARAGIKTARSVLGRSGATIMVPGIVEANAYREVVVRSVAPGQVRAVTSDLGATVRRGDVLATIHTPDLAETVRTYLSTRSEFDAGLQRLRRLESLVKIGAASQQELEANNAEHTRHAADIESARSRLRLLGMSANQIAMLTDSSSTSIDSLVSVTAPLDGVVSARTVNPGSNIDASTDLFTIVDLSSVWVVADVYEQHLGRVQVGAAATVTSAASTGRSWKGRVSYIDPQLAPVTRSARMRIEIANPGGQLRFGTYVDVTLEGAAGLPALLLPQSALQTIGSQAVVYVADPARPGRFVERPVAVRPASNNQVEVLAGITDAEEVVISGSFAIRAERDRLGLPPPAVRSVPATAPTPAGSSASQTVEVAITKDGFVPGTVSVKAGLPIDLVFVRRTEETCAKEVVVASANVRRALPLNQRVVIRLPTSKAGEIAFECGMKMLKGTLVVR